MSELFDAYGGVLVVIGAIGALIARWNETNKDNPWHVRLFKVLDLTQIFDSTRKLDE